MHFTIEHKRLVKMLETVRRKLPGAKKGQGGADLRLRCPRVCGGHPP